MSEETRSDEENEEDTKNSYKDTIAVTSAVLEDAAEFDRMQENLANILRSYEKFQTLYTNLIDELRCFFNRFILPIL